MLPFQFFFFLLFTFFVEILKLKGEQKKGRVYIIYIKKKYPLFFHF